MHPEQEMCDFILIIMKHCQPAYNIMHNSRHGFREGSPYKWMEANETIHFRKCELWDGTPDKKIHFLLQAEAIQLIFVKRDESKLLGNSDIRFGHFCNT